MGVLKLLFAFLLLGVGSSVVLFWCLPRPPTEVPDVIPRWWGKGQKAKDDDVTIHKFNINIPNEDLVDLKSRLAKTRYSEPLEDATFTYGFNSHKLREVVTYWKDKYDWRKTEKELNKYPHFKTQIDGIMVHFLRAKPEKVPSDVTVLPIMLIHGWPGSFIEFYKMIPEMIKPRAGEKFVFEVIVPSIPGYGFSEAAHKPGFNSDEAGIVFDKLMQRLGYNRYYVQGGDWGATISYSMAVRFPERVAGLHTNCAMQSQTPLTHLKRLVGVFFPSLIYQPDEIDTFYPVSNTLKELLQEAGYILIQSTKPDTVGAGLQDSPAGLAAYILEKFSTWTNFANRVKTDGALTEKFTLDELLDNIMIYWVTGSITSSQRLYKETLAAYPVVNSIPVTKVPAGIAICPNEISTLRTPLTLIEDKYPILLSYTKMPSCGHFAAFEEPVLLANDVWRFVAAVINRDKELKEATRKQDSNKQ